MSYDIAKRTRSILKTLEGAITITTAKDKSYLLAGRFVLGLGVSITATACPSYVVEMSPPQVCVFCSREGPQLKDTISVERTFNWTVSEIFPSLLLK